MSISKYGNHPVFYLVQFIKSYTSYSFILTYLGLFAKHSDTGIISFAEHLLPPWASYNFV